MLIYEVIEFLILLSILIVLTELSLPTPNLDTDRFEFRYYYSSCMDKVYGDIYLEQIGRIARVFKNHRYYTLEIDENC